MRHWFSAVIILALAVACKTPSKNRDNETGLFGVNDERIALRDFRYETDNLLLKNLGERIGCKRASTLVATPAVRSMEQLIANTYNAPIPYETLQDELFNASQSAQHCAGITQAENSKDHLAAMRRLLQIAANKSLSITFVLVGGFGSHLTENGALADSRSLWEREFAQEIANGRLRVLRHECMPNSYASDEVCAPKLVEKFSQLEAAAAGQNHRYLFWGYSKGGNTILEALGRSPAMRDKTLAMVSVGSPIGGGLPIEVAYPLIEELARKRSALSTSDQILLNLLVNFGAGGSLAADASSSNARMIALLEEEQFKVLQGGFKSILPGVRKNFLYSTVKSWDFSRGQADPLTGKTELPILHVAAALDIATLRPVPIMTIDRESQITPSPGSADTMHLAELSMLGSFRRHPLNDTCVALEHAVLPKDATPRGAKAEVIGLLALDHMSLGFSAPLAANSGAATEVVAPAASVKINDLPRTAVVDALLETAMQKMGVN